MTKNLSGALKAAKKDRGVLSKNIIWESGVSKTQFYRIINGEEAPSPESKKKISESLGIGHDQFDELFNHSKKMLEKDGISPNRKNKWLVPILALSILMIGAAALMGNTFIQPSDQKTSKVVATSGDGTLFIKDVTIPDGTSIPINTTYEKIWRVKNTGTLVWKDRYLVRTTPASSLVCSSPTRVPIPETQPGETIDISVTFRTPYLPGSCRTDWKTADKDGNIYFPDMHGLYSIVVVVAE